MNLSEMNKLVNRLSDAPFEYGKNDCYLFTAKLVKQWHGKDYLTFHSKAYKDEDSARQYIEANGGIVALVTGTLGYPVKDILQCGDGDVVVAEVAPGQLGIGFVFKGHGLFKMEMKAAKLPLKLCAVGWNIK